MAIDPQTPAQMADHLVETRYLRNPPHYLTSDDMTEFAAQVPRHDLKELLFEASYILGQLRISNAACIDISIDHDDEKRSLLWAIYPAGRITIPKDLFAETVKRFGPSVEAQLDAHNAQQQAWFEWHQAHQPALTPSPGSAVATTK